MKMLSRVLKITSILFFLYLFLISISLMSHAFKGFGAGFAEQLITTTSNPFVGLFIGILATSIIQSSSTTTSMVVAFVASGVLSVRCAIPIVMGANIGTTVTNTLVALGHITRKEEFKRALSGSTIHDFFNILAVIILFPIEMTTRYLERTATFLSSIFCDVGGVQFTSPVKMVVKPAVNFIDGLVRHVTPGDSGILPSGILLALAVVFLFLALYYIVRIMRGLVIKKVDMVFGRVIGKAVILSMFMGMLFTAIVQSSSITTSILVPLIAAGILEIEQSFPIVLGANVGTTVTAILASFTGNIAGITVAFVHLIFNLTSIIIIYPLKALRNIPLKAARFMSEKCAGHKAFAFIYVLTTFYVIPIIVILLARYFKK